MKKQVWKINFTRRRSGKGMTKSEGKMEKKRLSFLLSFNLRKETTRGQKTFSWNLSQTKCHIWKI